MKYWVENYLKLKLLKTKNLNGFCVRIVLTFSGLSLICALMLLSLNIVELYRSKNRQRNRRTHELKLE